MSRLLGWSVGYAQLSQIPVNGITWWHTEQTLPIRPSFTSCRASLGDSLWASMQVLHARRACICSSVANSGVPRIVPSPHSKWLQSGSCRSLGVAPVLMPSRCSGYTTYLMSGCSTVPVIGTPYDPGCGPPGVTLMPQVVRRAGCADCSGGPAAERMIIMSSS